MTLVEGDNGEVGRLLYQYLVEKYDSSQPYDLEEDIYAPHYDFVSRASWIRTVIQTWGKDPTGYGIALSFTAQTGVALSEEGECHFWSNEK